MDNPIATALHQVQAQIDAALAQAARPLGAARLVAVSKTHPIEAVRAAIEAGQTLFGENRVQEAAAKFTPLRADHPNLRLHIIGGLQTNKAKDAVAIADTIESLDRPRLADAIADAIQRLGRSPTLLVQVNIGDEPQKAGVAPGEADAFLASCRDTYGLVISGLMCIPPVNEAPAPHFALTAKIAARNGLKNLSMGMSADFAIAIQFGATHVRVGSAIFGKR